MRNPKIIPISVFFTNAKSSVKMMPMIMNIDAMYRFFSKSDEICFLNPTRKPNEQNIMMFIIVNSRANFLIRSKEIATIEKTPLNTEKNVHVAKAIILSVKLRPHGASLSKSVVRLSKPVARGIYEIIVANFWGE